MAQTFEIFGEVATDVTLDHLGGLTLILETAQGLHEFFIPRVGNLALTTQRLLPGDRVVLEIETLKVETLEVVTVVPEVLDIRPTRRRDIPRGC